MSRETVLRRGLKILGTLSSGTGDPILTLDPSSKETGTTPPIDTSTFLGTSLTGGYLIVGNASNIATPRQITGSVIFNNLGVSSIAPNVITNTEINSAASIVYSKLNLSLSVTNSDIAVAAQIARTKIANGNAHRVLVNNGSGVFSDATAITANRLLISDSNGIPTHSVVTNTEASHLAGVSSAIQTQFTNKLSFSGAITPVEGDLVYYTGGVWSRLPRGSNGQLLVSTAGSIQWQTNPTTGLPTGGTTGQYLNKVNNTNYNVQWSTLTLASLTDITASAAQVNVLNTGFYDATSSVQTQLGSKLNNSLSPGAIFFGNASSVPSQLSPASNGQVLTLVAGYPQWQTVTGTGTVTSIDVSGGTTGLTTTGGPVSTTGTITLTGTVNPTHGGTGIATYTTGDILYASASNVLSKLAAGTNTYVLTMTGGVPVWAAPSGGGGGTWGSITGTLSAQTDLQAAFDLKSNLYLSHNTQTGNYVLVLTDKDTKLVEMNVAGANTVTIPLNSSVAFPIGTQIPIAQYGAGLTSVVATGGVTINTSSGSLDSPGQYAPMVLEKRGTNEWYLWNGTASGGGSGTVTSVSVVTANGVSGSVATATTTPAITLTLGAITPTSVNSVVLSGSSTPTLAVTGTSSISGSHSGTSSGTNTGDQTITLTGEATGTGTGSFAVTLTNSAVIGKVLTGYTSGAGTVAATDTILQAIQKLNGNDATKWSLATGGTLTGVNTVTSNTANQLNFDGTWTATANNQYHIALGGSFTARSTASDSLYGYVINPTLIAAANTQVFYGVQINPTFTVGAFTSPFRVLLCVGDGLIANSSLFLSTGLQMSGKGLSFNGSSPTANAIEASQGFSIRNSSTHTTGVGMGYTNLSATGTSGTASGVGITNNFIPTSGTANYNDFIINGTINQTGGANGSYTSISCTPTYTAANTVTFIDYNPGITSIAGVHYGIILRPAVLSGFGQSVPTAMIHIGAGSSTRAQLKLDTSTLLSSITSGVAEYDNNFYVSNSVSNRLALGGKIAGFTTAVDNASTTETDLFTYTTKANTFNTTDEEVEFTGVGTLNDLTATARIRFYFAGTLIGDTGVLTVSAIGGFVWTVVVKRTGSTIASASVTISTPGASTAQYTSQTDLTGLTFSNTNIIKITGTAGGASGGTGDITAKHGKIMWWPAANN